MEGQNPLYLEKTIQNRREVGFPCLKPPWGLKEIFIVLIFIYLFGFIFNLFGARFVLQGVYFPPWLKNPEMASFFLAGLVQTILLVGFVMGFALGRYKAPLVYLGFNRISRRVLLTVGLLGGCGVFCLVILMMALITIFLPHYPEPQPFAEVILKIRSWQELLVPLLLGGVLAPLGEEIYFRGFVYPVFRSHLGVLPAVLISAVFFAALHFDLPRFLPLVLGGAGLAVICEKTGSLFPALVAHGTWNVAMILLVFFYGQIL